MDLKVGLIGWEGVEWIFAVHDRDSDKWRGLMNTVLPTIQCTLN